MKVCSARNIKRGALDRLRAFRLKAVIFLRDRLARAKGNPPPFLSASRGEDLKFSLARCVRSGAVSVVASVRQSASRRSRK
eukprot:1779552-Lingulodinium_polyedra.AAC.1